MNLARIARIPARLRRDLRMIRMLKNYQVAIAGEWAGRKITELRFRNGLVLKSPESLSFSQVFFEVWMNEIYCPPGYKIGPDDVVIDIGANIGAFSIYAASRARNGKIYAYEPFADCLIWLRKNVEESRLTNVRIHSLAVAGKRDTRQLCVDADWYSNSLYANPAKEETVTVSCIGLDEVFSDNGLDHCDLLKLDCEGAEYEILEDCPPDVLNRVRRISGEYHQGGSNRGTGEGLCRFLRSRSFRVDKFEPMTPNVGIFCATNMNY
jgi:FkbM family methyltransferase